MLKWLKNCSKKKDMNIFIAVGRNKRHYIWKSPPTLFPMTTQKIAVQFDILWARKAKGGTTNLREELEDL